jgi:glycolate oxidase FAD binding subunit
MAADFRFRICRASERTMQDADLSEMLSATVRDASARRTALRPVGGDSKRFFGRAVDAVPLPLAGHRGIVNHDPAELVLTARCGTPLVEVERLLAASGQRLPFEPPHFGPGATLGGTIAAGLAGPARARFGPVRDAVLGVRLLTGDGRLLRFGGEVIKNVAGYDVSRLMTGSLGVLAIVLEVSLKLLPGPRSTLTLEFELDQQAALAMLDRWAASALPMSAAAWLADRLLLRFEGADGTLANVSDRLGGKPVDAADDFWRSLREQTHPFFAGAERLWRLSLPPGGAALPGTAATLIEWGGMQRWYRDPGFDPRTLASSAAGTATLFRGADPGEEVFTPLDPRVLNLHRALKQVFDPAGILNPGRMYAAL